MADDDEADLSVQERLARLTTAPSGPTSLLGLPAGQTAAFCYVPVPPIDFLVPVLILATEPRKGAMYVRFHAFQALLLSLAGAAGLVVLLVSSDLLDLLATLGGGAFRPLLGPLSSLSVLLAGPFLAFVVVIELVAMWRCWQGGTLVLPYIGPVAAGMA